MTHIDNSKIFLNAMYSDASVFVPKETTYKAGTVLGRDKDGNLTAFSSDLNVEATQTTAAFTSSPLYILAQTITNDSTTTDETFDLVRVCEGGVVDKSGLIFVNEDDLKDVSVLDALHTNGFHLKNVEELTVPSSLEE